MIETILGLAGTFLAIIAGAAFLVDQVAKEMAAGFEPLKYGIDQAR